MPLIFLKNQLFICKLKKGARLTGLSIPNPNFSEIAFSDGYLQKAGSLEFSFQAIHEAQDAWRCW
jgi:hypothetical protein